MSFENVFVNKMYDRIVMFIYILLCVIGWLSARQQFQLMPLWRQVDTESHFPIEDPSVAVTTRKGKTA